MGGASGCCPPRDNDPQKTQNTQKNRFLNIGFRWTALLDTVLLRSVLFRTVLLSIVLQGIVPPGTLLLGSAPLLDTVRLGPVLDSIVPCTGADHVSRDVIANLRCSSFVLSDW
jgi:hypothetical protein